MTRREFMALIAAAPLAASVPWASPKLGGPYDFTVEFPDGAVFTFQGYITDAVTGISVDLTQELFGERELTIRPVSEVIVTGKDTRDPPRYVTGLQIGDQTCEVQEIKLPELRAYRELTFTVNFNDPA